MGDCPDNEEWTVVTARDKKRVMHKRGVRRGIPPQNKSKKTDARDRPVLDTVELIDQCVKECIHYLRRAPDSGIWRTTMGLLEESFSRIDEIVCFGVGNFAKSRPTSFGAPLWQVSFALALQAELNCSKVTFYDPVALPIENEYLQQQHGCAVLETNDRGRYKPDGCALFFCPHCPRLLYENILQENWGREDLCLIGNSLERIVDSCNFMPCTKLLLPFCTTRVLRCTKDELEGAPGNLFGAFNDTFLCLIKSVPWLELERPIKANDDMECRTLDCELL